MTILGFFVLLLALGAIGFVAWFLASRTWMPRPMRYVIIGVAVVGSVWLALSSFDLLDDFAAMRIGA